LLLLLWLFSQVLPVGDGAGSARNGETRLRRGDGARPPHGGRL